MERNDFMKKILWLLFLSFSFLSVYEAEKMVGDNIGYYFKAEGEVKEMKKYHSEGSRFMMFKKDYDEDIAGDFRYSYGKPEETELLEAIIYYGYNANKTDENYYYTQIYIWQKIYHLEVTMCDREGNPLEEGLTKIKEIEEKVQKHYEEEYFFKEPIRREIWTTNSLEFNSDLDFTIPYVNGLNIQKKPQGITITNNEVGEYAINYKTNYAPLGYWYNYEDIYFFNSLQGPEIRRGTINYIVYGTPFIIKEELEGINGKIGDITETYSSYDLYLNDDYKTSLNSNSESYVKSWEKYTLRGGYSPFLEEFSSLDFTVNDEDNYEVTVKRKVISTKVNLNILDDNIYYIYLLSNNELYYIVSKDTKEVTLPYGTYYITNLKNYALPLIAKDTRELSIEINNPHQEENKKEEKEKIEVEEVKEIKEEKEAKKEQETLNENRQEEIINPQTKDNIDFYITSLISSLSMSLFSLIILKNKEI